MYSQIRRETFLKYSKTWRYYQTYKEMKECKLHVHELLYSILLVSWLYYLRHTYMISSTCVNTEEMFTVALSIWNAHVYVVVIPHNRSLYNLKLMYDVFLLHRFSCECCGKFWRWSWTAVSCKTPRFRNALYMVHMNRAYVVIFIHCLVFCVPLEMNCC